MRLSKLHDDTDRSLVTEKQLAALGLPTADLSDKPLLWFGILADLIGDNGLLLGLDEALTRVDEAPVWIREKVKNLLKPMNLTLAVKEECEEKLVGLLLVAHDTQAQVFEGLFQETAKLSPELTAAVIHWTGSSFYSLLLDALDKEDNSALIDQFQRVSQHAEIVINLRLSNSTSGNILHCALARPRPRRTRRYCAFGPTAMIRPCRASITPICAVPSTPN
ncbi:hypothetical protein PS850_01620 [Pseudomonas fluorescens]|nr:hypothetical protein PS850_01620 [Pseudomonas fluorescens]